MKKHFWFRAVMLALLVVFLFVSTARADTVTATIPVGTNPDGMAVNPVSNKIYVANSRSNTVTVIDGATNATTSVAVGSTCAEVAVDPTTNKVYVAHLWSSGVMVTLSGTGQTGCGVITVTLSLSRLAT